MRAEQIKALQNEPACQHNQSPGHPQGQTPAGKAKAGCARPQPGATQGGCAFDGARNALLPIADVAHIVHGPIGCAGSSWDSRGTRSSGPTLYRLGLTTDLSQLDIILGRGGAKLEQAIEAVVTRYRPAAVLVYITCVPASSGDDIGAVAREAAKKWGLPVIPVDGAGFYGNKNLGNRIAGEVLSRYVIGTAEPEPIPAHARRPGITNHDVTLIGEWNVGGEFWNVAPLLDELGLRVLATLTGDSRFRQVQTVHRAEAAMVVCSKAMLPVARRLKEDHGVPFFEGSFYGRAAIADSLRGFARLLNDADLSQRTEALIAREEARSAAAIAPWLPRLAGKRVLVFTGGYKSWSVVSALQDLGLTVVATGTEKSTEEDRQRIHQLMGPEARLIADNDQTALLRSFEELGAEILVAGDRYIYPALKARLPFLDVDHVRELGYAGYHGLAVLARQLAFTLDNPVWAAVSRPAPWHARGDAARPAPVRPAA